LDPVNDEQPTESFQRLPYPSAHDANPSTEGTESAGEASEPTEPPKGWRARRRAKRESRQDTTVIPVIDVPTDPDTEPPVEGTDLPGPAGTEPLDVPEPLASSTRGLRRQRKRLLKERDQMIFHLGGLAYELHRLGELRSPVAERRAGMIVTLDSTVESIEAQLISRGKAAAPAQRLPIVVGSCRTCRTLFVADARYCMKCGLALAPAEPHGHTI
jgi:hypothetical protein